MRSRLRAYIVPSIVLLTVLGLVQFPLADCIDCEGTAPWGRNDAAYLFRSDLFGWWVFGTSFFFGLFRARGGWIAPLLFAVGDFLTQHIGGVVWWSLFNNEGPFILLIDSSIGLSGLALGALVNFLASKARAYHQVG